MNKTIHYQKEKPNRNSLQNRLLKILFLAIILFAVLLGTLLAWTLHTALGEMKDTLEDNLMSAAASLSENASIREALQDGECPPELTDYLDSIARNIENIELLTIADADSVRIYHVNHENIGKSFVGGDEQKVLAGESYFSDAEGTRGMQHRAFSPVKDQAGSVIGFVMVSTTMKQIRRLRNDIIIVYVRHTLLFMAILLLLAYLIRRQIRKFFMGYVPEELIHEYLTQNELLNNLEEGVVAVSAGGSVRLANEATEKMLGKSRDILEGGELDVLISAADGESLNRKTGENLSTSRPEILATCIPVIRKDVRAGTTLILKDKSDAIRRAEQLTGTRNIVSALRANTHEFMNRLQVIFGFLQMGKNEEAMHYISGISAMQAEAMAPILQKIHNAGVAALLLGKLNHMRENEIRFTLLSNSFLPEHSSFLSTQEMLTIIGNLLENAIESINEKQDREERCIDLQLTETKHELEIAVSDTGTGIPGEYLDKLFLPGFSTKAKEGRGIGMGLIHEIVTRSGGTIDVDSEPGEGTSFTIICCRKKNGSVS